MISFFFKAKQRGVVPAYNSMSLNEQSERNEVVALTRARRLKRAAVAKEEEQELFADAYDDEVSLMHPLHATPLRAHLLPGFIGNIFIRNLPFPKLLIRFGVSTKCSTRTRKMPVRASCRTRKTRATSRPQLLELRTSKSRAPLSSVGFGSSRVPRRDVVLLGSQQPLVVSLKRTLPALNKLRPAIISATVLSQISVSAKSRLELTLDAA